MPVMLHPPHTYTALDCWRVPADAIVVGHNLQVYYATCSIHPPCPSMDHSLVLHLLSSRATVPSNPGTPWLAISSPSIGWAPVPRAEESSHDCYTVLEMLEASVTTSFRELGLVFSANPHNLYQRCQP